jgi:hypothetical protein
MAMHLYDSFKCMAMKKIIISTLFFLGIAGFASAQTTSTNRNSVTKHISTSSHKAKKPVSKNTAATITVQPDNRKEYVKDGQLATPTGHQATPVNSDQYQSPKDSSNKKKKKQ